MLSITTIVLTYNEELHIRRCIENALLFSETVYVIDCFSTDNTTQICSQYPRVTIIQHKWPGNHAEQFNWALDNIDLNTDWILRLDADEYLTQNLINELHDKLPFFPNNVTACVFPLGRVFCGRLLKHGVVNDVSMIRLFRRGKARYEDRIMDEHLRVFDGDTVAFNNKFVDHSLLSIDKFIEKHNSYASKEAYILLDRQFGLLDNEIIDGSFAEAVSKKRGQKGLYARLPLFHRAIWYFLYRYIIKLGFLDGREGFEWDFFQGLWYRLLVDAKIYEVKKACGKDREKMIDYFSNNYGFFMNKISTR